MWGAAAASTMTSIGWKIDRLLHLHSISPTVDNENKQKGICKDFVD
jgi:hypothetical protein